MDEPAYEAVIARLRALAEAVGEPLTPEPASASDIAAAEQALGASFPASFRRVQAELGGVCVDALELYEAKGGAASEIVAINCDARGELFPRLPPHLIAFADNGGGDYLCFDTAAGGEEPPVVWWDHEAGEDQTPEPAGASFLAWLNGELAELESEDRGSPWDQIAHAARQILSGVRRGD